MTALNQTGNQPIIELHGVTKVYGTGQAAVYALRGVDLSIERGEFVAVMGPSGSGKSTCMNILGCLDTSTSGTYKFEGIEVDRLTRYQLTRLRRFYLGFVFQGFNLLNRTSALESHTPGELSGGQQQRVAIARAIVTKPEVLFADEPTGNLDTARSREIMDLLTELNRKQGVTIVMVTHEHDMAAYATRVVHFLDGLVESDRQNGRKI